MEHTEVVLAKKRAGERKCGVEGADLGTEETDRALGSNGLRFWSYLVHFQISVGVWVDHFLSGSLRNVS